MAGRVAARRRVPSIRRPATSEVPYDTKMNAEARGTEWGCTPNPAAPYDRASASHHEEGYAIGARVRMLGRKRAQGRDRSRSSERAAQRRVVTQVTAEPLGTLASASSTLQGFASSFEKR